MRNILRGMFIYLYRSEVPRLERRRRLSLYATHEEKRDAASLHAATIFLNFAWKFDEICVTPPERFIFVNVLWEQRDGRRD